MQEVVRNSPSPLLPHHTTRENGVTPSSRLDQKRGTARPAPVASSHLRMGCGLECTCEQHPRSLGQSLLARWLGAASAAAVDVKVDHALPPFMSYQCRPWVRQEWLRLVMLHIGSQHLQRCVALRLWLKCSVFRCCWCVLAGGSRKGMDDGGRAGRRQFWNG
jgi:hypothetical protein